jgi:hypothetical protein
MIYPLKELYNRHKGQEIWIVGSDPSLSEYPDTFLQDKLSLTLHLAHRKFPNATWRYSSEYDRSEQLMDVDPNYQKQQLIAAVPMYGETIQKTKALLAQYSTVYAHRMRSYLPTGIRGEVDQEFTNWKVRQTLAGKARIFGGHGTCLHTAIYSVLMMGVSKIHLIGAGHGMYKPEVEHFQEVLDFHFQKRPHQGSFADSRVRVPIIRGTLALIEACKNAGVDFQWYRSYTPAMDDKINVDPQWLQEDIRRAQESEPPIPWNRVLYRRFLKRPYFRIISRF